MEPNGKSPRNSMASGVVFNIEWEGIAWFQMFQGVIMVFLDVDGDRM